MLGDRQLEQVVYDTVRYFSLFKMPVTAVQIWRALVAERDVSGIRWHGHHVPKLKEIINVLDKSQWLKERIGFCWGYYYLQTSISDIGCKEKNESYTGRDYVRQRLIRHSLAQQKWKITRRVVRLLAYIPFVRMIAGSGSLSFFNTDPKSDLDLFIIVQKERIWTARLFLLIVSQFSGRRRKYWDEVAPDKVCLNHYVTSESLLMRKDVRNLYTAQLYPKIMPLVGLETYRQWIDMNLPWIRQWIMYPDAPVLPSRLYLRTWFWLARWQQTAENFLMEFPGDVFEKIAAKAQLWVIEKHTQLLNKTLSSTQYDRIVVSNTELAFHPNTSVPRILKQFEEEEGQRQLL